MPVAYHETNAELFAARKLSVERAARPARLRAVIREIDATIQTCEEAHLDGVKRPTAELLGRGLTVLDLARQVVEHSASAGAAGPGGDISDAGAHDTRDQPAATIVDLMDLLWHVQSLAFDQLLPGRHRLPDLDDDGKDLPGSPRRAA